MKYLIVLLLFLSNGCVTVQSKNLYQKCYTKKCFKKSKLIKYKHDEGDYWQLPKETIELKTGDCEDKAFYLLHMLSKRDIDSRVVIGHSLGTHRSVEASDSLHAWNEVKISGETYILDSTNNTFEKKNDLKGYYEWDITQEKSAIDTYTGSILYYINRVKTHGYKEFAKDIEQSFFIGE